jgi:hypothetical protein
LRERVRLVSTIVSRLDMDLKNPSCTVGEADEPEAVPVEPFLALTVLAGEGF